MLLPLEAGATLNDKTRGVAHASHRSSCSRRARPVFLCPNRGVRGGQGSRKRTRGKPMGFVELLLLAIGLSMDAFAVSVCKGLCMKRLNLRQATVVALFFGGFQALMRLSDGRWARSSSSSSRRGSLDRLRAFGPHRRENCCGTAFHEDDEELSCPADGKLDLRELVMLAVATSIDALAVGITFAFLRVDILTSVGLDRRHDVRPVHRRRCRGPPLRRPLREDPPPSPAASSSSSSASRSCWNTWGS